MGLAFMVLGSSPSQTSQMHQHLSMKHCLPHSQSPQPSSCHGEILWHGHILHFGHMAHPWGMGRSAWLCACTANEAWLAGHRRCRDFQSFPVLSHSLSMDVQETKKLSSLLCYFSSLVTLVTVSKCNAHDILLLP